MHRRICLFHTLAFALALSACSSSDDGPPETMGGDPGEPLDPSTVSEITIDRFSEDAGTLMVRSDANGLPDAGEAIDFDQGPFITEGLGPDGSQVRYYNFDVQPPDAAPIYALFREGEDSPVEGQLNIVGVVPGDSGYSDFWQVHKVTVPEDYEANSVTSESELMALGYEVQAMDRIVNCPIVPKGSTATVRLDDADAGLVQGWYDDRAVYYFDFSEKELHSTQSGASPAKTPVSPIFVTFNINPDEGDAMSGPASGFVTEEGSMQTHNVIATVPSDEDYSPLWLVSVYDNADFTDVTDLASAEDANILAIGIATVNCPVVEVE